MPNEVYSIENIIQVLRGSEAFERRCRKTAEAALERRRLRDRLPKTNEFRPRPFRDLVKFLCGRAGLNQSRVFAAAGLARKYSVAQASSFARFAHALGLRMADALYCLKLDLPEANCEPVLALELTGLKYTEELDTLLSKVHWSKESRDLLEEFSRALQREYERD